MPERISRREFLLRLARWGAGAATISVASSCGLAWTGWRKSKPNVIIITLDTLRADHLSCYGYPRPTTPTLDRMAAQGVRFARAYAHCERTNPSHVSILSSLHPQTHGVLHCRMSLSPEVETLQKMLRVHGYATMAAVSVKHLGPEWGLAEGFGTFYPCPCEKARRPGEETVDLALNWISTRRDQPFFAWIHLFDPHWVYEPPSPYDGLYYDGDPYRPDNHSMDDARASFGGTIIPMANVTDLAYPVALYDGAITYCDTQIARILDALRRTGQEDDTLIVITSDHGEGFGEHRIFFNHFGLHEEQTRVPLILYYPRYQWKGKVVDGLVGHVDIVPTILDSIGLPIPNELEGYSLVPTIRGEPVSRPQMIYSQMFELFAAGLVTPEWKYIHYLKKSPTPPFLVDFEEDDLELYDLTADPTERVNLAQQTDARTTQLIREFQDVLTVWQEPGTMAYQQEQLELDDATEQMLRDLGY